MTENIRKVLDQFVAEGLDGDWGAILEMARKELEKTEESLAKLNALERAGVDNWEWYDDAMESLQ